MAKLNYHNLCTYPKFESDAKANSPAAVQRPEDGRDALYDNQVAKDWRRGFGQRPNFDRSKAGR
jgi:hypothetical protein